jgi:glutathione synthase/RimK-type ligase-like ATP-grasp enzyme
MVPTLRVNTEDFPFSQKIDYRPGCIQQQLFAHNQSFHSIWYRRVRVPARPSGMDPGIYDFCVRESRNAFLGGILGQRCRWMSRPEAIWKAEFKPYQLDIAAALGFAIPKTLISNVPDSIRDFFSFCGQQMIAEPVRSGHMVQDGIDHAVYTTKIVAHDLECLEDAALAPTIFQECLPKRFDVRVTVVGKRIFAVAIDSQKNPDASIDWRRTSDPNLPHHRIELPAGLQEQVFTLMAELNLEYGALDFVLTPDGRFVFLEINPNGPWLWLDDMLSLGITTAVAEWLSGEVE